MHSTESEATMTCLMEINRTSPSPALLYEAACRYRRCGEICLVHAVASGRPAEVEAGQRVLLEAARTLRRLNRELAIETRLEIGETAERLLRVAKEIHPALIVMSAHGEGDFPRLGSLGRVARDTLEQGQRPILLVSPSGNRLCRPHRSEARRRMAAPSPFRSPTLRAASPLQTATSPL
jgi:nucleotide-binding universal stress UspA family protein